jgi:hypothetical protein
VLGSLRSGFTSRLGRGTENTAASTEEKRDTAMTKIEECAVEYIRLVNEAARLKTAARNSKCGMAEYPMVPEDGPGVPPCWASYDAKGDHIPLSEYCEACKGSLILREQRKIIVKQRQRVLAKLKRVCKE